MKKTSKEVGHQNSIFGDPVVFEFSQIDRHWETFAALAWSGYLAEGVGALLFTQSSAGGKKWDCIYFPLYVMGGGPRTQKYKDMIKAYNPLTEVVALFLTAKGEVAAFSGSLPQHLSPPNAFEKSGSEFKWVRHRKLVRRRA
jgi:hypothetical protein